MVQPLIYGYRSLLSGMAIAVTLASRDALQSQRSQSQPPPLDPLPWPPVMIHLGHTLAQDAMLCLDALAPITPAALPLVLLPWRLRYPQRPCDQLLQILNHRYDSGTLAAIWIVHEYLRQHLSETKLAAAALAAAASTSPNSASLNMVRWLDRDLPEALKAPIADLCHYLTTSPASASQLPPPLQPLALALHYLQASGGDYRLAIGRGLKTRDSVVTCGLIGALATATTGLSAVPLSWRSAMTASLTSTNSSLQQVWGCREVDLWQLADSLLAGWAGVRLAPWPRDSGGNIPVVGMPYLCVSGRRTIMI